MGRLLYTIMNRCHVGTAPVLYIYMSRQDLVFPTLHILFISPTESRFIETTFVDVSTSD